MDALEQANLLVPGTRRNLLSNRLVLIVPNNSTTTITGFRQLTDSRVRRISVGEFRSVPAGQYSEQVLDNLGILEEVRPKIVFANNVRGVLAAVESGNVDAGMVYATDAKISDQVRQVATAPEQLHSPLFIRLLLLKIAETLMQQALIYSSCQVLKREKSFDGLVLALPHRLTHF